MLSSGGQGHINIQRWAGGPSRILLYILYIIFWCLRPYLNGNFHLTIHPFQQSQTESEIWNPQQCRFFPLSSSLLLYSLTKGPSFLMKLYY